MWIQDAVFTGDGQRRKWEENWVTQVQRKMMLGGTHDSRAGRTWRGGWQRLPGYGTPRSTKPGGGAPLHISSSWPGLALAGPQASVANE